MDEAMRVICCGSRDWVDSRIIWEALSDLADTHPDAEVVHGAARGADSIAGRVAKALGLTVTAVPADWNTYGKAAGAVRNKEMLGMAPDRVYAFRCLGESKGTDNMIQIAQKAGVPVAVYLEDGRVHALPG
jgi:hypothetical protein